jgi:hypothetical protein
VALRPYTTDLQSAVAAFRGDQMTVIVAMTDHGQVYEYPSTVGLEINDDRQDDYVRAADYLNRGGHVGTSAISARSSIQRSGEEIRWA